MTPTDPPYAHGDIVLVAGLLDPQGRNPKDRSCVVITNPQLRTEGRQFVVAISTVLPDLCPTIMFSCPTWIRAIPRPA